MTQPGERNERITFERPAKRQSAMGREPAKAFETICGAWAKVLYGTGAERRQAGAEGAAQTATFRVLASSQTRGVTARDRIWFDGRGWNITAIAGLRSSGEIEFTGVNKGG